MHPRSGRASGELLESGFAGSKIRETRAFVMGCYCRGQQKCLSLKVDWMNKQFDAAKIARLTEIKEEILDLLQEGVSLVRGTPEEQRANHWYATVCTALDKENTQGDDTTITMQETIDALRGDADS